MGKFKENVGDDGGEEEMWINLLLLPETVK